MSTYNKVIFRKYYIGQPAALLKFFMQQKKYLFVSEFGKRQNTCW